jgi:hypothetical protein
MGFSSEQLTMGMQALKHFSRRWRLWEYTPNLQKAILPLDLFDRKPFKVNFQQLVQHPRFLFTVQLLR